MAFPRPSVLGHVISQHRVKHQIEQEFYLMQMKQDNTQIFGGRAEDQFTLTDRRDKFQTNCFFFFFFNATTQLAN